MPAYQPAVGNKNLPPATGDPLDRALHALDDLVTLHRVVAGTKQELIRQSDFCDRQLTALDAADSSLKELPKKMAEMFGRRYWVAQHQLERLEDDQKLEAEAVAALENNLEPLVKARRFVVVTALRPEIYPIKNITSARDYEFAKGPLFQVSLNPATGGHIKFGNQLRMRIAAPLIDPDDHSRPFDIKLV